MNKLKFKTLNCLLQRNEYNITYNNFTKFTLIFACPNRLMKVDIPGLPGYIGNSIRTIV